MNSLHQLLQEQLRDLYDAEIQYTAMLPAMIGRATHQELREALTQIAAENRETIQQVEEICDQLDTPADGVLCEAMRGLVKEASATTNTPGDTATIDASLIANAQRIAHYEIAGFGTARAFARCLGKPNVARLLADLTERSGNHDRTLTQIATGGWFASGINEEAAQRAS